MLASIVGILIYFLVKKKQPASLTEANLRLKQIEDELQKEKEKVIKESEARKKAEAMQAATEIKLLEETHKKKIEALNKKEKKDYEAAKNDPTSGVDYMRELLGVDTGDSASGTGTE